MLSVVREQITRALGSQPANLEKLRQKLYTLTYSEITNLWQQERTSREQWESHARPIVQLKELVTPEIVQLIKKQRLNYMVDGTRFTKYSQRGQVNLLLNILFSINQIHFEQIYLIIFFFLESKR